MRRVLVPLDLAPAIRPTPARPLQVHTLGGATMGTTWSVRLAAPADRSLQKVRECIDRVLDGVVAQMSNWIAASDISRFNRAAAETWCELPADFYDVLQYALSVARDSGGAYDPTIGALVDLWGFGPAGARREPPDADAIAKVLGGWWRVRLASERRALQPGGVELDLSSVAKGFAVDRVADELDRLGIADHLVEIGGELRGTGLKPDGTPWWVALGQPDVREDAGGLSPTVVALHGLAVATSGDAQRYIECGGRRLSHTIDPRTGYPVPERMASVTVLHRRCMCADALATALTVLGPDAGFDYAGRRSLAARFLVRRNGSLRERMTPSFAVMLE